MWYPEQFISKNIPALNKYFDEKLFSSIRLNQLTLQANNLHKDTNIIVMQGISWIIGLENLVRLDMTLLKLKQLQNQYTLLLQGNKIIKY